MIRIIIQVLRSWRQEHPYNLVTRHLSLLDMLQTSLSQKKMQVMPEEQHSSWPLTSNAHVSTHTHVQTEFYFDIFICVNFSPNHPYNHFLPLLPKQPLFYFHVFSRSKLCIQEENMGCCLFCLSPEPWTCPQIFELQWSSPWSWETQRRMKEGLGCGELSTSLSGSRNAD